MIGEFQRGATFRAKQEVSIFETIPLHECETGLYVTREQLWEVDGFNEELELYILICKKSGIALKMSIEDIRALFDEVNE